MENMLYPIGIQSFSDIRERGFVYVDKTAAIYKMASSGKFYFLSRPRRFGKSLLVSTMEAYFKGKKELFKGLAIESLEKDWAEYPILHLDFGGKAYNSSDVLLKSLDDALYKWEKEYGSINRSDVPGIRFGNVIEAAYRKTGSKAVVLVDEYDKPIMDNLTRPELRELFRETLEGFYGALKTKDDFVRFGFLTGVTKIGKMSVFSGLNNLNDISMDDCYADICGISEMELRVYFDESVKGLALKYGIAKDECYERLARMYDGYHFCENSIGVYNPFSLLNTFNKIKFGEYWFETGTPSFLVQYLKYGNYLLEDIPTTRIPADSLSGSCYDTPEPVTLMYQSGYLTIKDYNEQYGEYNLDYPNEEVKSGFLKSLSQYFAPALSKGSLSATAFVDDIKKGDVEGFMNRFTAFLSGNSYQIQGDLELYFQNIMAIMFKMMGLYVNTEYQTSNGRIDIVIDTAKYVYIIELKRDQSPDAALRQIEEKGYDKPFLASGKTIVKLGINFSSQTRTVDGWKRA